MRAVTCLVATATVALLLSACGTDPSVTPEAPVTSGTGQPGGGDTTQEPVTDTTPGTLDPTFAVEPPGKRKGPITVADILISARTTIDPETVEEITNLDGVVAATTLSMAQAPVENKVYNLAAVDPAVYRLFTTSADFQEQWNRVAAGEVAASDELEKKLALDKQGFVTFGRDGDQPLHLGAWAPQAEQVDLVVNELRGEALGMVPGNALLLSTGQTAPEALRDDLERIVGDDVSVQNLDAAARYGLDPDAFQTAQFFGTFGDAVGVFRYTPTSGGRIAPEPLGSPPTSPPRSVPILGSVTCNKALMPQLKAALAEIVQLGLEKEIHPGEYAGCYYPRFIAGSTKLSNHSFGLALDINTPGNQRGTVGEIDRGVVAVFKRWGFAWGGDWNYTDPMHFELAQIVRPG